MYLGPNVCLKLVAHARSPRNLIPIPLSPKPQSLLRRLPSKCLPKELLQLPVLASRLAKRRMRFLHPGRIGQIDIVRDAAVESLDVVPQAGALGVAWFDSG